MAAKTSGNVTVYLCTVDGKLFTGDTLPKECYKHGWVKKVNGIKVEEVDPPEVAEQKRAEQERKKAIEKAKAEEQRVRDNKRKAVLATYIDVADLDKKRNRAIEEIDSAIKDLEDQIKADGNSEQAVRNLQELIKAKTRDRDEAIRRFEEDRKIFVEIESEASGSPVKPIEREVLIEVPADSTKK